MYSIQWAANSGVPTSKDYPYPLPAATGICDPKFPKMKRAFPGGAVELDATSPATLFKAWHCIAPGVFLTLRRGALTLAFPLFQALKANGPLAITMWADSNPSLQYYKTGIYSHSDRRLAAEDHAVTLVGWGEEKMKDGTLAPYWIIMNSWGATWWVRASRPGQSP